MRKQRSKVTLLTQMEKLVTHFFFFLYKCQFVLKNIVIISMELNHFFFPWANCFFYSGYFTDLTVSLHFKYFLPNCSTKELQRLSSNTVPGKHAALHLYEVNYKSDLFFYKTNTIKSCVLSLIPKTETLKCPEITDKWKILLCVNRNLQPYM